MIPFCHSSLKLTLAVTMYATQSFNRSRQKIERDCSNYLRQLCAWMCALFCLASPAMVSAQSHAAAPGVIINEIEAPSYWEDLFGNGVYVSDPSILVLSNGDYLASHAQFGGGSDSDESGRTQVFRSSDKGQTWTQVNGGSRLDGILRGSLFEHDGAVYLYGSNHDEGGSTGVIMRSNDYGNTWSSQSFGSGGFATPNNLVEHNDRFWLASTISSVSFAAGDDPYQEDSWLRKGGFPAKSSSWLDGSYSIDDNFIGEGQIAASPDLGVHILSKVRMRPYIALSSVNSGNGLVTFDPDMDFVKFRGGEKKVSVRYDATSGNYYMLANPILPKHENSSLAVDLVRNTAAVFSSTDLRHWQMKKIFLYSENLDYEGFQYFNFDFDGDDIVVASRTAFDVGGDEPPRGHDSNLLTFHQIEDFRTLEYQHVLRIQNGLVQRYERTGLSDAPLGSFTLGTQFDGSSLSNVNGIAYLDDLVYVRESGGRILTFDLMGNFQGVDSAATVTFQSGELDIPAASENEFTWLGLDDGDWMEPRNWFYYSLPPAQGATAIFGSAADAATVVDVPSRDRSWHFDQANDTGEWASDGIDNFAVSSNGLGGTITGGDPKLIRKNLNFDGDQVTTVRIRMRIEQSGEIPVNLFWATSTNNGFAGSRLETVSYNGDGAFQELVFEMAGQSQWANRRITQLRIDPTTGGDYIGASFDVESVVIDADYNWMELAGLEFNNAHSYTLAGGALRIDNENTPARINVRSGAHVIEVPVEFRSDSEINLFGGSELSLTGPVDALGELDVTGAGVLSISGGGEISQLSVSSSAEVKLGSIGFSESGAVDISSEAQLRLLENEIYTVSEIRFDGELMWSGSWGGIGSGADYESERILGPGIFNVTSGPNPGYAAWVWVIGLSEDTELAEYWEDPDQDGVVNLFEWFFGGDPLDGMSQVHLPTIEYLEESVEFRFTRSKEANSELATIFQYSETLSDSWSELNIGEEGFDLEDSGIRVEILPVDEDSDSIVVVVSLSDVSYQNLFMRLKLPDPALGL